MTNKAMFLMAPGVVELRDIELPEIKADEVLVKSEFSAISAGTELANFNDLPNTVRKYPRSFGYNAVGVVEEVGENVKNYKVGDKVLNTNLVVGITTYLSTTLVTFFRRLPNFFIIFFYLLFFFKTCLFWS